MTTGRADATKADTEPILEVRDATVTFDMSRGVSRVLDGVSLDVQRDEVLGIVGESGSGKSMLADSLLDAVDDPGQVSGSVRYRPSDADEPVEVLDLDDEELRTLRWEEISMVFQGAMSSWNPTMKIRDHFEETIEAHDEDLREGMERTYQLLSDLYLDPDRVLDSYPHELSGGMKQRTLIALSLVLEPDVLVMDEPTAALDLLMQRSIISLLERLKSEYDLTLVFITHDLPLVAHLADRLAVMYAFQLAEIGPTEEILTDSAHPYTRLLLETTPNLDAPLDEMEVIEGSSPDPVNTPSGCRFHPRCPMASEICTEQDPGLDEVSADHRSACFFSEDAADEIPFNFESRSAEGGSDLDVSEPTTNPTQSGDPLVEVDDVTVEFDAESGIFDLFSDSDGVRAVDGVDLDIYENDVVALVGESGCGKTTLGKAIIGVHRPTEGSVEYRGQDIWDARDKTGDVDVPFEEIRRSLQIIHQDPGSSLNPNKRVIGSLAKPLKKWRPDMSREDRDSQIMAMLEHVGMTPPEDYANRYPHQLSGGEKQRVALTRSLLMNPDAILADEAISALDVSLRVEMMDLMLDLQDLFDTSFVFISHDLSNARYLAEKAGGRIAVMYLGEIVEVGPVEQIIHNPQHPYTQVLRWATPNLDLSNAEEPPVRQIDIPDPQNPPSGCRFHTRCPEARDICRSEHPDVVSGEDGSAVACFRADPDHEYWESSPVSTEDTTPTPSAGESD